LVKRNKPVVGTKLIPSIENIEGCYKYNGIWDNKYGVCVDKNNRMLAPIKGALISWKQKEDPRSPAFPFVVKVVRLKDLKELYSLDCGDAVKSKRTAVIIGSLILKDKFDLLSLYGLGCYNFKTGKSVSCKNENAVLGPNPLHWNARYVRYDLPRLYSEAKSKELPVDVNERMFYYRLWSEWASKRNIQNIHKPMTKKTEQERIWEEPNAS